MTSFKKLNIKSILIILISLSFAACVTDDYDLSNGINTDISVGGDSLTVTIAKTNKILLGSLVDGLSLDILDKSSKDGYSFSIKDSTGVSISTIDPVTFTIAPITIPPVNTKLASTDIPPFDISPISINSILPFPSIDVNAVVLPSMNESYTKIIDLSKTTNVKRQTKSTVINKSKSDLPTLSTGLVKFHDTKSINQALSYPFPDELQKINTIFMKNNTITLVFDKTGINNLGFSSQTDTITYFRLNFPAEYVLSSPTGTGTSISGNSFIISNAVLSPTSGVYTATFKLDKIDFSNYNQSLKSINYSSDISYTMDYSFVGETNDPNLLTKKANVTVSLTSSPKIDNMDIVTNEFGVNITPGGNTINKSIPIPIAISKVNSITFQDGASLELNIADPSISPFSLSAGSCVIQLPQKFIFKPAAGLDLATNILTIPYNQLFGIKTIGISGMNINQTVQDGAINISDNLSYSINGIKVGSQAVKVNAINGMTGKQISVTGTIGTLTIKNASVDIARTGIDVPTVKADFSIDKTISTDLKKIYSLTLKTPTTIELNMSISNLPNGIDSIYLDNYKIQFPRFLKFKTGDLNSQNELVFSDKGIYKTGFKKTLTIEEFNFGVNGKDIINGNLNLNDSVKMSGKAYIKSTTLNSSDISSITISPTVTIGSMTVGVIDAQIATPIAPIKQSFSFKIPENLSGTKFDIVKPSLQFEIGNSLGIPMSIGLKLAPKSNQSNSVSTTLNIKPAVTPGQVVWSKYILSNNCKDVYSSLIGYDSINTPNLPGLLSTIGSDEIEIDATPTITGNHHIIDFYSPKNEVNFKYAFNVPLSFGSTFVLKYNDTIPDLKKTFGEILKFTNNIDIIAIVDNSIPLRLALSANALDASKNVIDGVVLTTKGSIEPCNVDGSTISAKSSELTISLSQTKADALKLLDKLAIKISASSDATVAGIRLNASQYIKLELRIRVPKGVNLNLSSPSSMPRKK